MVFMISGGAITMSSNDKREVTAEDLDEAIRTGYRFNIIEVEET